LKKINCHCGTSFDIETKEKIDLTVNPEVVDQIINNSFMEYNCPVCEKILQHEYRINLYNEEIDLTMIPEIERDSLLAGSIDIKDKQVVVGFQELREKFIIRKFSYDDRIIELIKLYIMEKINSTLDINILFTNMENENLIFHIYGLKEKETGISKIPEHIYNNIYDNLEDRLKTPGINDLLSLPYRSVNKIITEVK
jgi:CpXC protein